MADLDDPNVYSQYDPQGMLGCLHEMPQLCQRAWQMAKDFDLPPDYRQVNKVVVLGMGGSAIGGDLVSSLVANEVRVPILVHRDYSLPAFVDNETLVIASSYSGKTEETLASFNKALNTEAKKLVITTGGTLESLAQERGIPVFHFDYKAQPRAALPFSMLSILGLVQKLGFIGDRSAEVAEMVAVLEQLAKKINETVPLIRNQAKQLARRLYGHLAIIYGGGLLSEVAHRWKTQFNENSKAWAFHEVFSELNHNAVVGYQFPPELASRIMVVLLRSVYLPERIILRQQVTAKLLKQANIAYQFADAFGISPLTQMMSLVLFGDYVSYYLAILNQIDPSPVAAIDYLKEQLAKE